MPNLEDPRSLISRRPTAPRPPAWLLARPGRRASAPAPRRRWREERFLCCSPTSIRSSSRPAPPIWVRSYLKGDEPVSVSNATPGQLSFSVPRRDLESRSIRGEPAVHRPSSTPSSSSPTGTGRYAQEGQLPRPRKFPVHRSSACARCRRESVGAGTPARGAGAQRVRVAERGRRRRAPDVRVGARRREPLQQLPTFAPTTRDPVGSEEPLIAAAVPASRWTCPCACASRWRCACCKPCPRRWADVRALRETALLVALPIADPVVKRPACRSLPADLVAAAGLPPMPVVRRDRRRHTAVFELLEVAERLIEERQATSVIPLAVDSYLTPDRLPRSGAWRRCGGQRRRSILVRRRQRCSSSRARRCAGAVRAGGVLRRGRAWTRSAPTWSPVAELGAPWAGMIAPANRRARRWCGRAPGPALPWVLRDLNGESYRAYEGRWRWLASRALGSVGRLFTRPTAGRRAPRRGRAAGGLAAAGSRGARPR